MSYWEDKVIKKCLRNIQWVFGEMCKVLYYWLGVKYSSGRGRFVTRELYYNVVRVIMKISR